MIKTEIVLPSQSIIWNDHVNRRTDTNFVDAWNWRDLMQKTYHLPTYSFWAKDENENICGLMALTHTRHPLLGSYLSTAVFDNWGGFYADSSDAENALLSCAHKLRLKLKAEYAVIRLPRDLTSYPTGWQKDSNRAWYSLSLLGGADKIFAHLSQNLRSKVRRSMKQGFRARWGKRELLMEFHHTLSICMRELGSPLHPIQYYYNMFESIANSVDILLIDAPNRPAIGSVLMIRWKDRAVLLHGTILRTFRSNYAGNFMYWEVIRRYAEEKYISLDMGRSLSASGNETFKMEWKPARYELPEWYDISENTPLPGLNQANPKFKLARYVWQRLPLALTKYLGPKLMQGLL